jgi:serine/threonine-protein kinase
MSSELRIAAVPVSLPSTPTVLGEYELVAKIASGGMATVYVARKRAAAGFERLVAIKLCHSHLRDDPEFVSMFLDEARLAARIRHPNVVGTLDVSEGDPLYLVMEYIEGFSLAALIKKACSEQDRIPPGVALRIVGETLTGLHAAHELRDGEGGFLGLVHRDVSPQNIIVGVDGVSRITDFGIAYAVARSTVTQEGRLKGKLAYLSPEQVRSRQITRQIDVFSAGIVLWETLTGRNLFRRPDDVGTIKAVLQAPILPPSSIVPGLPKAVDAVVLKALERDPRKRYATAADFADAIDSLHVDGATMRAVTAYTEKLFAKELSELREVIRAAPTSTPNVLTITEEVSTSPSQQPTPLVSGERSKRAAVEAEEQPAPANDDIEHRRLRGALAAAMLLLVGSALGLLWSRVAPKPEASPATTATTATLAPASPGQSPRSPSDPNHKEHTP